MSTVRQGSTREYVYNILKNDIINLEIKPGTRISEKEIAHRLQVSRTPVREAFMKLAQEELLGIYPQSGTIVSRIDLNHVEEARFVRENIERSIVKMACTEFTEEQLFILETNVTMQELCLEKGTHQRLFELDEEFHKILFEQCGKIRTWKMINQLKSHFDRLRILGLASNKDWNDIVIQHKQIFTAIVQRNPQKAEELMINHLRLVNDHKKDLKQDYPEYFL
ncbi:GntR family transcriptional regulator [Mesobacillus foraminis]|nr:GntR family transcriptional regulator [Mesobacillus foraminis]MBT2757172.1 GntR family transcriptional regulator [Mesobacillus foraminis]